jgi:hypothetical protein
MNMVASILVDFRNIRCSACKVLIRNELAKSCKNCNATFDSVSSNHVGLADKLRAKRGEALIDSVVEPEDRYPDLISS